jgi:hypothetical protein
MIAPDDRLGEERAEGGLNLGRPVERREEQQVVQLRPKRARPRPDQREVPSSGRPELLHGLHLPLGRAPRLGRQKPVGVGGEHHLAPAPPAARMAGDAVTPVPQGHGLRIGPQREGLPDQPPGDGVAVPVERHPEGGRDDGAPHLVRVVGLPEREQVRPLLGDEERGDLPRRPVLAGVGEIIAPGLGLRVQIGEVAEGAPRPEVRPKGP